MPLLRESITLSSREGAGASAGPDHPLLPLLAKAEGAVEREYHFDTIISHLHSLSPPLWGGRWSVLRASLAPFTPYIHLGASQFA